MWSRLLCLAQACASKYIHITLYPVCVSMCVMCVSMQASRSGEQMEVQGQLCWCRSWESSHGAMSLGENTAADRGHGWRTEVMEPDFPEHHSLQLSETRTACLWLRLSSHLPVWGACLPPWFAYTLCDCCPKYQFFWAYEARVDVSWLVHPLSVYLKYEPFPFQTKAKPKNDQTQLCSEALLCNRQALMRSVCEMTQALV